MVEELSMRGNGCRRQIAPREAGFLVTKKVIEYLAT
jgi:hypothetical protein